MGPAPLPHSLPHSPRLAWPLPALLAWGACWALFVGLAWLGLSPWLAMLLATAVGLACGVAACTRWRRVFTALGFPLSLAASGLAGTLPAWSWLLPLGSLALLYPLNAWRDAPLFPTPRGALAGLARRVPLPQRARVLDAGCGLGAGLAELRRAYPTALLTGLEWSWPLRWACAWRCPFASVRRADIWAADWAGFDLVYLFQRPESMPRAAAKAGRELRRGAWLASLEFEVPALTPNQVHECPDGRRLWLYRAPFEAGNDRPAS